MIVQNIDCDVEFQHILMEKIIKWWNKNYFFYQFLLQRFLSQCNIIYANEIFLNVKFTVGFLKTSKDK